MEQIISGEYLKKLELNALLEITTAISKNVSKEDLYKIFKFTLRGNHLIKKVALFVKEENNWECACHFGAKIDFSKVSSELLESIPKTVHEPRGKYNMAFEDFDVVLPVYHKDNVLALVFVDGDEAFGEDLKSERFDFIQTLSNVLLYAVENKRLFSKQLEQQALKKELEIASRVQAQLIPKKFPKIKGCEFYSTYIPHSKIGGDYYDLVEVDPNTFYVCIADVSGKGVPAAIFMSNFQASLRILLSTSTDLVETVKKLNRHIIKNTGGDYFITFFIAKIDLANKEIEYINAGHNQPLMIHKNSNSFKYLSEGCTFLGAFDELPKIKSNNISFEESILLLYTDGLTETFNENYEEFSLAKIEQALETHRDKTLEEIHKLLIAELDLHKGSKSYSDDITIFSVSLP
jgi:phosphoserine phosphatase RsbU/P